MDIVTVGVLVWLACVATGAAVGKGRGNTLEGVLYPVILGPVGLLLAIALVSRPADDQAAAKSSFS